MSILDANPEPKPDALWPEGFKERANAQAAAIITKDASPDVLAQVVEQFPAVLLGIISGSPGMLPSVAEQLVGWAELALAKCIKSVTVTTEGAVTVVDHRSKDA